MTPLITIGIACYNAADTILRAIHSALCQDWSNIEVIVVDDLSTDDSTILVEKAIADSSAARLIRRPTNGGPAATRNTILMQARGEFIAFFDDDDESKAGRVRIQYQTLLDYEVRNATKLVACYASGRRRYPNGYELPIRAIGCQAMVPKGAMVADYLLFNERATGFFYGAGTPTCALMARRSTFAAVGGFDDNLRRVEDVDFAIRLALAGGHFIGCANELYLQHATTAPDKTPEKSLDAELKLVDKYAEYLRSKGRYGYARTWFKIRFYYFGRQYDKFLGALAALLIRHPISGIRHLLRSGPRRWLHERGMNRKADPASEDSVRK